MKNLILTTAIILLSACSSGDDVYKETIANYVQTDKKGTWYDLKFKAISLDAQDCTVSDSIQILIEEKKAEIAEKIKFEEGRLKYYQEEAENSKSYKNAIEKKIHDTFLRGAGILQRKIDSLQRIDITQAIGYEGVNPENVLAVHVTCKYGIVNPWSNTYQEQTEIFVLTPDGKKVIGKQKRKDNDSPN